MSYAHPASAAAQMPDFSTIREAPPSYSSEAAPAPAFVPPAPPVTVPSPEPASAEAQDKPRKKGWWSMRG